MTLLQKHGQSQRLVITTSSQTVFEASKLMSEKMVGSVLVMDQGKLVGIFTERDLLNRIVSKGLDPRKIPLSQVMTPHVITVDIHNTPQDCYEKMQQTHARHVPIMDGEKVIGIVTMRNLLEWLWKEIEEENAHLKSYIQQS